METVRVRRGGRKWELATDLGVAHYPIDGETAEMDRRQFVGGFAKVLPVWPVGAIAGAAHLPHLEKPDALAAAVHGFLRGLGA